MLNKTFLSPLAFLLLLALNSNAATSARTCTQIFSTTHSNVELLKTKNIFQTFDREDQYIPMMCHRNILEFLLRLQEQKIALEEIEILYIKPLNWSWFGASQPRSSSSEIRWRYHVVARYGDHIFDFDNADRNSFPSTSEYFKTMFRNQLNDIHVTKIPGNLFYDLLYGRPDTEFNANMVSSKIRAKYPSLPITNLLNQRQITMLTQKIEAELYSLISQYKKAKIGIAMEWTVDEQGKVTDVSLDHYNTVTSDPRAVSAVADVIRRQRFDPAPKGQTIKIQHSWSVSK